MALNTNEITKQMIDFQKTAFASWYDAVTLMQDQTTNAVDNMLSQSGLLPDEGSKTLNKWVEVFKTNRKNLKKQVDDGFKQAEQLLVV